MLKKLGLWIKEEELGYQQLKVVHLQMMLQLQEDLLYY